MNLEKKKSEFYLEYQLRNNRFYIHTILPFVTDRPTYKIFIE